MHAHPVTTNPARRHHVVLALLLVLIVLPGSIGLFPCDNAREISVAFVGNSLQFYNDLPHLLGELFERAGYRYTQHNVLREGGNLKETWDLDSNVCGFLTRFCPYLLAFGSATVMDMLEHRDYDFMVLNDHSQWPARPETRNSTLQVLRESYAPVLLEKQITPILYQTYAYRADLEATPNNLGNFTEFFAKVKEGYQEYEQALMEAGIDDVRTAPVGQAFADLRESNYDLWYELYRPDNLHPSVLGSLLCAYLMFWTMTGEAPSDHFELRWFVSYRRSREGFDGANFDLVLPTRDQFKDLWELAEKVYMEHNQR